MQNVTYCLMTVEPCWELLADSSRVIVSGLGMELIGRTNSRCKTEFGLVEQDGVKKVW